MKHSRLFRFFSRGGSFLSGGGSFLSGGGSFLSGRAGFFSGRASKPVFCLAILLAISGVAFAASGCGDNSSGDAAGSDAAGDTAGSDAVGDAVGSDAAGDTPQPSKIRLLAHNSFVVSQQVWDEFEAQTGIEVEVVLGEDVGSVVSQVILTKGNPVADVVFGIDNTFLTTALRAEVFEPYVSGVPALPELYAGTEDQVTPIDFGDVCINYWKGALDTPAPQTLADLADERFKGLFVTQNPETSSPGLAFLLATIAYFGEDGWEDFWRQLRDNDVLVTSGWTEAYYGSFTAGGGDYPLVTSYASSPVAEVVLADFPLPKAPTAIIEDSCFRQVEYAGILAGSDNVSASRQLIDFMLSDIFQQDIPLNMFVFPASPGVELPEVFVQHAQVPESSLSLAPDLIAENKNDWTERWTEIVLR